jgi:hypothetical protein
VIQPTPGQPTPRQALEEAVRSQATAHQPWERAEHCLLEGLLRERLALLGIDPSAEVAATLMATAMLLAEYSPEFGGDYRDALAVVAQVGLALLPD